MNDAPFLKASHPVLIIPPDGHGVNRQVTRYQSICVLAANPSRFAKSGSSLRRFLWMGVSGTR